eukprot:gene17342-biopygen8506
MLPAALALLAAPAAGRGGERGAPWKICCAGNFPTLAVGADARRLSGLWRGGGARRPARRNLVRRFGFRIPYVAIPKISHAIPGSGSGTPPCRPCRHLEASRGAFRVTADADAEAALRRIGCRVAKRDAPRPLSAAVRGLNGSSGAPPEGYKGEVRRRAGADPGKFPLISSVVHAAGADAAAVPRAADRAPDPRAVHRPERRVRHPSVARHSIDKHLIALIMNECERQRRGRRGRAERPVLRGHPRERGDGPGAELQ